MNEKASRLIRRLECFAPLLPEEKLALENAVATPRHFAPRESLIRQGTPLDRLFFILEGFAVHQKLLPDGRRQISAFMLPGDMCDLQTLVLARIDHTIAAISPVDAAVISPETARRLAQMPTLSRSFTWNAVVNQSIAREWILNIGHRTSFERLSHLLCEIFVRLQIVGLTRDHTCEIPLTQTDIADALALTSVHVNRTLMELRRSGLVTLQSRHLVIHDFDALRRAAGFDAEYLHCDGTNVAAV